MIYETVNVHSFREAFKMMGRGNQFSYDGLEVLFDYLDDFEPDVELDVIAICCDFEEVTFEDMRGTEDLDDDASEEEILEYLESVTTVVGTTDDSVIYYQY
jgi:hypothetical protein